MYDLRRLLTYLKPHWATFSVATLAMVCVGVLESAIRALIVPILDQASSGGDPHQSSTLFGLQHLIPSGGVSAWRTIGAMLVVFSAVKGLAEYLSTYLMARIGQSSVLQLREDVYHHVLSQSATFFERHRSNYIVSRIVTSAAAIEIAVSATFRDMLREGCTLIAFQAASFYYNWRLTTGALVLAPIIGVLTAKFGRALRNLSRESFEGNKLLTDTAQEAIANQNIVKAYGAEKREESRFRAVAKIIVRANLRSASIAGFAPPTIEMIGVIAIVFLLFVGQREIMAGRMNIAQFVTFLVFLFSSYDPMRKLSRLQNGMEQALAAAQHVWELLDEDYELPEKPHAHQIKELRKAISLNAVDFEYPKEVAAKSDEKDSMAAISRMVLKGIDLRIDANTMVALVGESGAGKSTLTKLLPRFHDPTSGSVTWDDLDIRDASVASVREQIALVTQETVLFNDTVRHNISYGRPDATDEQVREAARVAFAAEFIERLPNAYETIVGERGVFLSGGQRQRIAIARAVLKNAPVLILDEATSALDAESERLVQKALANLISNRTTVVIAHRLSTVRRANKIVVMDNGRIVETGTHSELLELGGRYRRLYELQFADEEREEIFAGSGT